MSGVSAAALIPEMVSVVRSGIQVVTPDAILNADRVVGPTKANAEVGRDSAAPDRLTPLFFIERTTESPEDPLAEARLGDGVVPPSEFLGANDLQTMQSRFGNDDGNWSMPGTSVFQDPTHVLLPLTTPW